METDFEIIQDSGSIAIKACGNTLSAAFINAARALSGLITSADKIKETVLREVEISAPDQEFLLVEWLNELIYFFDAEQLIFKRFEIDILSTNSLKACCYGEKMNKTRHELIRGIKAVTYHRMNIKYNNNYELQVILDI